MELFELIKYLEAVEDKHGGGVWIELGDGCLLDVEQIELRGDEDGVVEAVRFPNSHYLA